MMNVQRVSIVGAGVMGLGIAQVNAMHDIETTLIDLSEDALKKAKEIILKNLQIGIAKGKLSLEILEKTLSFLKFETHFNSLQRADLFIEAVYEKMSLKKEIFSKVDVLLPKESLLASNTSSLSISDIASVTKRPDCVLGLHFFNPPYIMKLLEIIYGAKTSQETLGKAMAYAKQIRKTHVLVKDSPGFATSRLGICLGNEAMRMLEEGVASAEDIDTAMMLGYGYPMGPLKLTDLVGLDVRLHISEYLYVQLKNESFRPPRILKEKVLRGELGKKSGQGFYAWNA